MIKLNYLFAILLIISCQSKRALKKISPYEGKTPKQLVEMAKIQMGFKNFSEAQKALEKCLKLDDKNQHCHWELGWVYYAIPNWDKTVKHWDTAIKLRPKSKEKRQKFLDEALKVQSLSLNQALKFTNIKFKNKNLISISGVGDVMMGTVYPTDDLPKYDKSLIFKPVSKILKESDISFLNLEGPLCDQGKSLKCEENQKRCYSFRTPTHYASELITHFNVASIANNHIMDFGQSCYRETVSTLRKNNIHYSDGFKNIAEIIINNKKVAVVSFYTHKLYDHDVLNISKAKRIIKKLNKNFDLVIVSFHAGAEGHDALTIPFRNEVFKEQNRGNVVKFSRAVIDAGADLVFGHGPHVLRGVEKYKNKLIAYSLGNFFTFGNFNLLGHMKHGVILKTWLDNNGNFKHGRIISTIQKDGKLKLDEQNTGAKLIYGLSKKAFPKAEFIFNDEYFFTINN